MTPPTLVRGALPIFKRELYSFFVTPLAWVVSTAFLFFQGFQFYLLVVHFAAQTAAGTGSGPVEAFFGQTVLLYLPLLVICPVLTMRLFAEERRSGTIEPLLTAPVSSAGVVLGKFGAALMGYIAMWLPTFSYMVILASHGTIDWNVVASGYFAVLLVYQ